MAAARSPWLSSACPGPAQDVSEENAELALGAKASAGALPAGAMRRSSLRRSRSSLLPAIPFYEGQHAAAAGGPPGGPDGYGEGLALQPVTEADAAGDEEVRPCKGFDLMHW